MQQAEFRFLSGVAEVNHSLMMRLVLDSEKVELFLGDGNHLVGLAADDLKEILLVPGLRVEARLMIDGAFDRVQGVRNSWEMGSELDLPTSPSISLIGVLQVSRWP
jgi:hypothetical protein